MRWISLLLVVSACSPAPTVGPVDVRVLYPLGGKGDESVSDNIFSGLVFARAAAEFEIEEVEPTTVAEGTAAIDRWVADRANRQLIVVGSGAFAQAIDDKECEFGTAQVLQLDVSLPTCSNLRSVTYRSYAPAYLGGVAAVSDPSLNPERTVGIIAGADVPPVRELVDGFTAGVTAAGGTVVRVDFVSNDPDVGFGDPATGRMLAEAMFDEVGVIYAVAGRSGEGVAQAIDDRFDAAPGARVYYVGSDVDQSSLWGRITIGSVLKRFDFSVRDAILDAVVGSYSPGDVRVGFADGFTEFIFHPRRGSNVIRGDCGGCDLFDPLCYQSCTTLEDVVDQATDAAALAAEAYEAR